MTHGPLQRYEIPDRPGHFLRLDKAAAQRMGILPAAPAETDDDLEVDAGAQEVTEDPSGARMAAAPTASPRARVSDASSEGDEGDGDEAEAPSKATAPHKKRAPEPTRGS